MLTVPRSGRSIDAVRQAVAAEMHTACCGVTEDVLQAFLDARISYSDVEAWMESGGRAAKVRRLGC